MQPKQNKSSSIKKEDNTIVEVTAKYLAYWPLFLVCLIISTAVAFLYLRYTVPQFEATATIIIKDERKGVDDSKAIEQLDMINTKKIIENEIEVLQSRNLMTAVVQKLHLYAPIYQEGKVKSISAYVLSPITIEAQNPDSIEYHEKINLDFDSNNEVVVLDKRFKASLDKWVKTPYGTLKFVRNIHHKQGSEKPKPFFFSLIPSHSMAGGLLGSLKVTAANKLSSIIILIYRNEIPKLAEDILNELIIAYGNAAMKEKSVLARNTLNFIEDRLNIVSKDLDSIEKKLQRYKTGKGAVDIGRQGQLYLENVSTNDKQLSELNMQVAVMNQLEKAASAPGSEGMLPSTLGVNDPALTQQVNSLSTLQQQYDKLKVTVAENNPLLVSVREQIDRLKPTILSNIQSQRKSLEQNRGNLYATGGNYNSVLSAIPQKERELIEISRDLNIKNGIYSFLLQKREESELSYASTIADSKVVNTAQSSKSPVTPKRNMILMLAAAIGLIFPIALITGREILSPKILYRNEIEALTTIPVLSEITHDKTKIGMVVKSGNRTMIAEEFRKLRVSLLSLGIDGNHRKILVTSSISGEGKSFISANLASSLSLTGKKVVLVDMDLHNPGLGKYLEVKDSAGVSDYLMGHKSLDQIIYNIPGNANLFYISSGNLQEDSSELLENGKVKTLISQLDNQFDIVLIDTAPLVLITDAYLLSSLCDATLYVIRHKFTPKMLVKRIDSNITVNPINNPAIVFNGVKTRGFFKNNYGYGHNNYVYGYENKEKKKGKKSSL